MKETMVSQTLMAAISREPNPSHQRKTLDQKRKSSISNCSMHMTRMRMTRGRRRSPCEPAAKMTISASGTDQSRLHNWVRLDQKLHSPELAALRSQESQSDGEDKKPTSRQIYFVSLISHLLYVQLPHHTAGGRCGQRVWFSRYFSAEGMRRNS